MQSRNSTAKPTVPLSRDATWGLRRRVWFSWVALCLPAAWMLGPALLADRFFVFRDVGYFYLPLWHWMRTEWSAGRVPLWNSYDGFGVPVVAEGTAAVFYPVWLACFALPLSLAACAKLYLTLHVLLAAVGAYRVVRRWQGSPEAAALAGIAYAYGGSVIFQVCNPPFLIGAAWLPWAILHLERLLRRRDWRSAIWLAVVLASMVLGGDPQMALHVMLIAAAGMLWYGGGIKRLLQAWRAAGFIPAVFSAGINPAARGTLLQRLSRPALLALAGSLAFCLAAVQILPSLAWSRKSTRAEFSRPRNIYEAATWVPDFESERSHDPFSGPDDPLLTQSSAIAAGLFASIPESEDSHHYQLYQFSQGPWRWIELAWPNVSGRLYPTHRRWMDAIPAEGIVWTPSLYMGLIPFLLSLLQLRFSRGSPRDRWLSWTAAFFAAGSLGWYGIGWLMRELHAALPGLSQTPIWLGQPTGGVYWFLVTFLPGYVYFRYPAKLWVVTALMLSLLAARAWDRFPELPSLLLLRRALAALAALAVGSALLAALAWLLTSPTWLLPEPAPDAWFGPFDSRGATRDVCFAFAQTAGVVALAAIVGWKTPRPGTRGALLLLITAVELCLANAWLLPTAPLTVWQLPSAQGVTQLEPNERPSEARYLQAFSTTSSPDRLAEILATRRENFFWQRQLLHSPRRSALLVRGSTFVPADEDWYVNSGRIDVSTRFAVQQDVKIVPPLPDGIAWRARRDQLQPLLARERAIIEWSGQQELPAWASDDTPLVTQVDQVAETPQHLSLDVGLTVEGFLVVRDAYDPDWRVRVLSLPREPASAVATQLRLLRADGVFLAVALPAGRYRVTFTYWPRRVIVGGVLSGLAWCGVVLLLVRERGSGKQLSSQPSPVPA